jgi:excisionase family DNA binding protein
LGKKGIEHFNSGLAEYNGDPIFKIKIWTIDDVASFLDLSKGTIYNKVSRREIPFRKPKSGRRLYFLPDEILNWVEEGLR